MATYIQYCGSDFVARNGYLGIKIAGGMLTLESAENHIYVQYTIDDSGKYYTFVDRTDFEMTEEIYESRRSLRIKTEDSHLLAGRSLMSPGNESVLRLNSKQQSKYTYDHTTSPPRTNGHDVGQQQQLILKLGEVTPFRFFSAMLPDLVVEMILVHA